MNAPDISAPLHARTTDPAAKRRQSQKATLRESSLFRKRDMGEKKF